MAKFINNEEWKAKEYIKLKLLTIESIAETKGTMFNLQMNMEGSDTKRSIFMTCHDVISYISIQKKVSLIENKFSNVMMEGRQESILTLGGFPYVKETDNQSVQS